MSATQAVVDFIAKVVKDMGLALEAQVETGPDGTRINLVGEGADALLARRGEGLQALQQITDSAFRKQLGDERLLIDCMDFRRGKDNELRVMAKFLAWLMVVPRLLAAEFWPAAEPWPAASIALRSAGGPP